MKMKHIAAYAVFVIVVVSLLFYLSGTRAPRIPDDGDHAVWDDLSLCGNCHGPGGVAPLSEAHPPKEQCLECHTVKDDRRRG